MCHQDTRTSAGMQSYRHKIPFNALTGKTYKGMNVDTLLAAAKSLGTQELRFVTEIQCEQLGGHVKAGEIGWIISKWFPGWRVDKVYEVFHVSQCRDLPD